MKRMMASLGLLVVLSQAAGAWRPSGWVYMDWPWTYSSASGDWYWFKTDDVQWMYGYPPADGWRRMGASGQTAGWRYVDWPFVYDQNSGAWFYINETDVQWVINMRTMAWTRFGTSVVSLQPLNMVLIPAGANSGTDPDGLVYSCAVGSSIYMDTYEVTKTLWDEVYTWAITEGGYTFDNAGMAKGPNHPVHSISWYDAVKWCNARSEKAGRTPAYNRRYLINGYPFWAVYRTGQADIEPSWVDTTGDGYRLPTESEWEYAARFYMDYRYPWGDNIQHTRANYKSTDTYAYDTSSTRGYHPSYLVGAMPYTAPVGSFERNAFHLYDMAGNVSEWCFDLNSGTDARIVRGGNWNATAYYVKAGIRATASPDAVLSIYGFRTVLKAP